MRIRRSEPFMRQYQRLPHSLQKKVDRVLAYLVENIRHPGARAKKVTSAGDIWEARVDEHNRLTFQIEGDTLVFRKVGPHDILKNP